MPDRPILVISGTNRPGANALRVAKVVEGHYRALGVPVQLFSLAEMPVEVFASASYAVKPPAMEAIRKRVADAAGLHVVVPEYHGSFPGVLKYFLDMLDGVGGTPVAFVGEAAGGWGGMRGVEQLQVIFGNLEAYVFPQRVFIPGVGGKFDTQGNITDQGINDRLAKQTAGFAKFVKRFA